MSSVFPPAKSPSEAADDLIPCRSVRESADAYTSRRDPIRCQNGLPVSQTNSTSPHVLKALLSSANRSANEQGLAQRSPGVWKPYKPFRQETRERA
ncbi:hypothetical protein KEM48_000906 [Puccinia striiformis f. sp. tritici PST-130]|nr:hypothetical protein KEM48_000906 [Puccinia striiformis f. sp. tritici PST-130]